MEVANGWSYERLQKSQSEQTVSPFELGQVLKGDVPGHPFHGNQYGGGGEGAPTGARQGAVQWGNKSQSGAARSPKFVDHAQVLKEGRVAKVSDNPNAFSRHSIDIVHEGLSHHYTSSDGKTFSHAGGRYDSGSGKYFNGAPNKVGPAEQAKLASILRSGK